MLSKHSIYALLCGTLMLASCSYDEPAAPDATTVEASFSVDVADAIPTRGSDGLNSALGGAQNLGAKNLNYILALYEVADNNTLILSDFCQISDTDGDGERFSPMVTLGKTYTMVALAHFGDRLTLSDAQKADYLKAMPVAGVFNSESGLLCIFVADFILLFSPAEYIEGFPLCHNGGVCGTV